MSVWRLKILGKWLLMWIISMIPFIMHLTQNGPLTTSVLIKAMIAGAVITVFGIGLGRLMNTEEWRNWKIQADTQVFMKQGDKFVPYYIAEAGDTVRMKKIFFDERYFLLSNGCYLSFADSRNWKMMSYMPPPDLVFLKSVLDGKYPNLTVDDLYMES